MGNVELKDYSKRLQKIASVYISLEKNEKVKTKWMEAILKDWRQNEVLEIAKSGGKNIGQPFRDKKGGSPFQKYRKWKVPVGWCLGVWSGATLYALMKAQDTGGIQIIKEVSGDSIEYGYNAGHQYINFNVGTTKAWLEKQQEFLVNQAIEYINKNLRVVMQ